MRFGLGQSPFPVPDCVVQALRENAHQKDVSHPNSVVFRNPQRVPTPAQAGQECIMNADETAHSIVSSLLFLTRFFLFQYLAVQGLPQLREAVAAYHTRETGNDYTADNVMIGPGSKELLFLVQVLLTPHMCVCV